MRKTMLLAIAILGASLLWGSSARANGPRARAQNAQGIQFVPAAAIGNGQSFFQETVRGPFGRIRSQRTVINGGGVGVPIQASFTPILFQPTNAIFFQPQFAQLPDGTFVRIR